MNIPGFENFVDLRRIEKGWSGDEKYCMTMPDGARYLLRISPAEWYESRATLHGLMAQLDAMGLPMCRPVAFGRCDEGVYVLQSWIEGEDLEDVLPGLPTDRQRALGLEAGGHLRIIHSIDAPLDLEAWDSRFGRKIDGKMAQYAACGQRFDGDEHLLRYIEASRHLLQGRPQCFQHGDYHVGNMMLSGGVLHIIDFDRFDYGDPWEEFNRIVWSAQASPAFASGMVDGYFVGNPPLAFWQLLALYIATNTLSSLPWAIPFGENDVAVMRQQAQDVLRWYDNMRRVIPRWYTKADVLL